MADEIKNLIEKIQEEGIKVAQDQAKAIELEAKRKAENILQRAKAEADKILTEANERIARIEQSSKNSVQQAGRDLLLSLRKEIEEMLARLTQAKVAQSLSPSEIAKILHELIKKFSGSGKEEIQVWLKKEDGEKLEKEFLAGLKEETKRGILLKPSEDISAGFVISFDAGKSHFDFTDKALAGYLSAFLRPQLREILEEAK
jgi:V/A-type H+/Na+-transporting ATPase subunit E